MNGMARGLVVFAVVFHFLAFVLEAFLWMLPGVHGRVLGRLSSSRIEPHEQALVLKTLFVNQGFYNLFLAITGATGLALMSRGSTQAGRALVASMCLSAVGAGVVLAVSTHAYVGAFLQAVPPALALTLMFRATTTARAA
jgi:putative membrane protein